MTLRAGAVPAIVVGNEETYAVPNPLMTTAREDAAAYEAWLAAGRTREVIDAERRERLAASPNRHRGVE